MTGEVSLVGSLPFLGAQGASFLALLLGASAVHKASNWGRSLGVVRGFGGVPAPLAAAALGAALIGELTAAALLIVPATRAPGALLAAAIWTGYLALLLRAILLDRRDLDCGCSFGAAHRPLGAFQLTRNAVLVAASLGVAAVSAGSGSPVPAASQLLGATALLALYGALDQVMALQPLRTGVGA